MKARLCLVLAAALLASCTRSNKQAPEPAPGATATTPPATPAAPRAAWVEQDGDTAERVGAAWAAWARGDRVALKQAAAALCPPEHCAARRAGHLLSKVDGAPGAVVTNTGVLLLEGGAPKRVVPMALGAGAYAKKWRDGRIIVDSPRYRRAYIVDTATGAVEKVLERQASDGQPSLLDAAPDLSSYVYVARDGSGWNVDASGTRTPFGPLDPDSGIVVPAPIPTGARVYWSESWNERDRTQNVYPNAVLAGQPLKQNRYLRALKRTAPKSLGADEKTAFFACARTLGAVCTKRLCAISRAPKAPLPQSDVVLDGDLLAEGSAFYLDKKEPKFFLTVPDSTPDILDNDAGFGFVDGEHHEILLVGCDGKVTKRTSTSAEEEHHVTAEAEAWRTNLTPQLCSARDAVLPAAACDELDVKPVTRVPSTP